MKTVYLKLSVPSSKLQFISRTAVAHIESDSRAVVGQIDIWGGLCSENYSWMFWKYRYDLYKPTDSFVRYILV